MCRGQPRDTDLVAASRSALQEIKTAGLGERELKSSIALRTMLIFINSDDLCYSNLDYTFLIYAIGIN